MRKGLSLDVEHEKLRCRVAEGTAKQYNARTQLSYRWCDAMGYQQNFCFAHTSQFCEWYIAGCSQRKIRAHTSLPQILSAWSDRCVLHGIKRFPFPGSSLFVP